MRKIYLAFAALASMFTATAQMDLPSNFYMQKLDNGLEVLVIEDNTVPLGYCRNVVQWFLRTEDSSFNGLSHLYEHMFFKANKDIPSQEDFLKRVNELGIVFNGTTSDERVNYFLPSATGILKKVCCS